MDLRPPTGWVRKSQIVDGLTQEQLSKRSSMDSMYELAQALDTTLVAFITLVEEVAAEG